MEFLHKEEAVIGVYYMQKHTLDPRGGIQFMDCEGDIQVWVTDCTSMNELYNGVIKLIMEKHNQTYDNAVEIFNEITMDWAFCGCPVDEFDDKRTPEDYTEKLTKAEYIARFYDDLEMYVEDYL